MQLDGQKLRASQWRPDLMGSLILGEDGRSQGEDAAGIGDEKSEGGGG